MNSSSWSVISSGSRLLSVVVVVIWLELSSMTGSDGLVVVSEFSASALTMDGFVSVRRRNNWLSIVYYIFHTFAHL